VDSYGKNAIHSLVGTCTHQAKTSAQQALKTATPPSKDAMDAEMPKLHKYSNQSEKMLKLVLLCV